MPTIQKPATGKETALAFKLVDEKPRKVLCEGRNYGIGWAFALRKGNELHLVQPISPCKDFMNDTVFSEATGNKNYVYGLHSEPLGCFKDGVAYHVMGIMTHFSGAAYEKADIEIAYLNDHLAKVVEYLNYFEAKIVEGLKGKDGPVIPSTAVKLEENRWVFIHDAWWCKYPYLISLYGKLMRIAVEGRFGVKGEADPMEFTAKNSKTDSSHTPKMMPRLKAIMEGFIPVQAMPKGWQPHNDGIMVFNFPDKP